MHDYLQKELRKYSDNFSVNMGVKFYFWFNILYILHFDREGENRSSLRVLNDVTYDPNTFMSYIFWKPRMSPAWIH